MFPYHLKSNALEAYYDDPQRTDFYHLSWGAIRHLRLMKPMRG